MRIKATAATLRALGVGKGKPKKAPTASGRKFAAVYAYCKSRGYPLPVDEFRFHPDRRWRWDVAWPDRMFAVEFQGAVWVKGRHTRGDGYSKDCEKYANAALMGWRYLPVTSGQFDAGVLWGYLDHEFARRAE